MKKTLRIVPVILSLVVAFCMIVGCSAVSKLNEEETALYNGVLAYAKKYAYNPPSIRIISGTVFYENLAEEGQEEYVLFMAQVKLYGTNMAGATITSYIQMVDTSEQEELVATRLPESSIFDEDREECNTMQEGIDYSAINDALEEYWEDFM